MVNTNIVIFDGVCNLCNKAVQFIIVRDRFAKFRFASAQGEKGQLLLKEFGMELNNFDTLVYLRDQQYYTKSTAVLKILQDLGGTCRFSAVFYIFPRFIRDFFYDQIAKRRFRYFAKQESCLIQTSENSWRFLV